LRTRLGKKAGKLWTVCLLIYSFSSLALFVPGARSLSAFFLIPLYLFVPGYALARLFFQNLDIIEGVFVSIGLSVALFLGVKGAIQTFGLSDLLSEVPILVAISAVSLVAGIISSK